MRIKTDLDNIRIVLEVLDYATGVYIFECIASEASTANPLKKRAFRRPMDQVKMMRIGF